MRISKEHGLNPSISTCFICGENKNEILLLGHNKGKKAPHTACYNYEPCDKCKEFMKQGIILISVRDGESNNNPYRTGGWVVIKEDAAKRILSKEIIDKRIAFVEDKMWDMVGLPREK